MLSVVKRRQLENNEWAYIMPDLNLFLDLSNFYSIRQQTAFNPVLVKHISTFLPDLFLGCHFFKLSNVLQDLS